MRNLQFVSKETPSSMWQNFLNEFFDTKRKIVQLIKRKVHWGLFGEGEREKESSKSMLKNDWYDEESRTRKWTVLIAVITQDSKQKGKKWKKCFKTKLQKREKITCKIKWNE